MLGIGAVVVPIGIQPFYQRPITYQVLCVTVTRYIIRSCQRNHLRSTDPFPVASRPSKRWSGRHISLQHVKARLRDGNNVSIFRLSPHILSSFTSSSTMASGVPPVAGVCAGVWGGSGPQQVSHTAPPPSNYLDDLLSDSDLELYILVLRFLTEEALAEDDLQLVRAIELEDQRRVRKTRVRRAGRRFNQEIDDLTDVRFRRYFRLTKPSFAKLCTTIIATVGEDEFRSEASFDNHKAVGGAVDSCGGAMSGEVRVAIFLCLLAGASYLDLMVIFQVTHDPVYRSFRTVCAWVNSSFKYPLVAALESKDL